MFNKLLSMFRRPTAAETKTDNTAFIITNDGNITLVRNGKQYSIGQTHPSYEKIVAILNEGRDFSRLDTLLDVAKTISLASNNAITINDCGEVFYNGIKVHNAVATRIGEFARKGLPYQPLVKFLENLMENPNPSSIDELYTFLEHRGLPITPDGCFIGYKAVREDWMDIHSGTFDNKVGAIHEMSREQVDPNRNVHCSVGFHVGTHEYASSFGREAVNSKLLLVKVNPRDAVSVPVDHSFSKLRVCRYEVISLCEGLIEEPMYGASTEAPDDESCDSNPYSEGVDAFNDGLIEDDNPYEAHCNEFIDWLDGWNEAASEFASCKNNVIDASGRRRGPDGKFLKS